MTGDYRKKFDLNLKKLIELDTKMPEEILTKKMTGFPERGTLFEYIVRIKDDCEIEWL